MRLFFLLIGKVPTCSHFSPRSLGVSSPARPSLPAQVLPLQPLTQPLTHAFVRPPRWPPWVSTEGPPLPWARLSAGAAAAESSLHPKAPGSPPAGHSGSGVCAQLRSTGAEAVGSLGAPLLPTTPGYFSTGLWASRPAGARGPRARGGGGGAEIQPGGPRVPHPRSLRPHPECSPSPSHHLRTTRR